MIIKHTNTIVIIIITIIIVIIMYALMKVKTVG